jgi:hypothetical protein
MFAKWCVGLALALLLTSGVGGDEGANQRDCQGNGQQKPSIKFGGKEPPEARQNGKIEAKGSFFLGENKIESIKLSCAPTAGGEVHLKKCLVKDGKWSGEIKPLPPDSYKVMALLELTDGTVYATGFKTVIVFMIQ